MQNHFWRFWSLGIAHGHMSLAMAWTALWNLADHKWTSAARDWKLQKIGRKHMSRLQNPWNQAGNGSESTESVEFHRRLCCHQTQDIGAQRSGCRVHFVVAVWKKGSSLFIAQKGLYLARRVCCHLSTNWWKIMKHLRLALRGPLGCQRLDS